MAARTQSYRALVNTYQSKLESFQNSTLKFRILETIEPPNAALPSSSQDSAQTAYTSPKTLFILDSSFNPPTIAHLHIAESVLQGSTRGQYERPHGLLLLLSTTNADKAPQPASFAQRLAMMTLFGEDLLHGLQHSPEGNTCAAVPVSIGVTTAPYYADKSRAIALDGSTAYPDRLKHVHLLGFDTLTRFFTAKYYKDFDPPFSALNQFFNCGHRLRVTLRPDVDGDVNRQTEFVQSLAEGSLEQDGARREWVEQIDIVQPNPKTGISSTKVRSAAETKAWERVRELCTSSIADYVHMENPYDVDAGEQ